MSPFRRLFLMSCVCAAALSPLAALPAMAQDSVNVRAGVHDDYSRLVFDWAAPAPYTVKEVSPGVLDIVFEKAADMNAGGVDTKTSNIRAIEKTSAKGANLSVRITIPAGSTYRHFLVGNRVVFDVYGKPPQQAAEAAKPSAPPEAEKQAVAKPEQKKAEEKKAAETAAAPAPVKQEGPAVPAVPAPVIEESKTPPAPTIVEKAMAEIAPHTVTVSSTTALGLAAFIRNDELWIVMDRSDVSVPPQIAGPQVNLFAPFERVDLDGGIAYRTALPEGLGVYGEGGGLVWKILLTPLPHAATPVPPERIFEPGQAIRGGTMFWPMQRVTKILTINDPEIGDKIVVGTVDQSDQFSGSARDFVDFSLLNSPVGIAVLPKADDLSVAPTGTGLQVTRPGGLALSRTRDVAQKLIEKEVRGGAAEEGGEKAAAGQIKRIYDFDRWMMGGLQALRENQQVLLSGMGNKDKTGKVQDLLMMAKMNMANDRGQEAVGLLNFAQAEMPEIADSPEFLALRGGAEAMAGKFEVAFQDLSTPVLQDYGELDYWRVYTLASLEDWQQASAAMPKNFDLLISYPRAIQERLGLKLAEVALREGDTKTADVLLDALNKDRKFLKPWTLAGLDYLKGEIHRQAGESALATELWEPLSKGKDDLYRTKASLALTMLELQNKTITEEKAIDRLEGLRYHWRGDEMEAQVNFILGKLYLGQARYLKGFTLLRDAAAMSPESDISREITGYMTDAFKNLFLSPKVSQMTPIDAVTVYEEFRELTPAGAEGNKLVQRLAERLVDADLLDRAATLLQHQVDYRLAGREAGDVAIRLAAIYLLNDTQDKALAALDKAQSIYSGLEQTAEVAGKYKEIEMLRARALSESGKVDEALAILNKFPPSPEINSLRADIAWNAGMWEDAGDALQDLILDESIDVARPLTQKQADLILNRAVALNLSGDRVALANMRTKYEGAMAKTSRAKMFDVVTRPRTGNLSADRDSIAALVSEVDMFKAFLDSYRASASPSN